MLLYFINNDLLICLFCSVSRLTLPLGHNDPADPIIAIRPLRTLIPVPPIEAHALSGRGIARVVTGATVARQAVSTAVGAVVVGAAEDAHADGEAVL